MNKIIYLTLIIFFFSSCNNDSDTHHIKGKYLIKRDISVFNFIDSRLPTQEESDSISINSMNEYVFREMDLALVFIKDSLHFENNVDGRFASFNYEMIDDSTFSYNNLSGNTLTGIYRDSIVEVNIKFDKTRNLIFYKDDK